MGAGASGCPKPAVVAVQAGHFTGCPTIRRPVTSAATRRPKCRRCDRSANRGAMSTDLGADGEGVVGSRHDRQVSITETETADVLRRTITAMAGPDAQPRPDQFTAVTELVDHHRRVLVVQATGWGKSAVYWAATAALRARGAGPTLVVSPLLALMRDQIAAAERAGLRAATVNSTNVDEWQPVLASLAEGAIDVLLISPERLANPAFAARLPDLLGRLRAAGHRRGPLRLGLGVRLPTGLPATDPDAAGPRCRHPGARDHRDRQRTGHHRRRRAARLGHGHPAGIVGPLVAPAGRGAGALAAGAVRVAGRRAAHPARLRHRLRPDRRRDRAGGRLPGRAGPRRGGVLRPDREPGGARGPVAPQRGQGAGGDLGARHGLRQARSGLLRPPRLPGVAGGVLPAGRAGRPRARRRAGRADPRRERRADLGVLRHLRHPRRAPGRADPRPAAGLAAERSRAGERDRHPADPGRRSAEDPGRRWRGGPDGLGLGRHRTAVVLRPGQVGRAAPSPRRRGRPDAAVRERGRAA